MHNLAFSDIVGLDTNQLYAAWQTMANEWQFPKTSIRRSICGQELAHCAMSRQ